MILDTDSLLIVFYFTTGSFVLSMLVSPLVTDYLYSRKFWKKSREVATSGEKANVYHKLHEHKHHQNIPTMAGIFIWLVVGLMTLMFNFSRSETYLPLFTIIVFGLLGLVDDIINVRGNTKYAGLKLSWKLFWLIILSTLGALWFYFKLDWSVIHIPGGNYFGLPYNVDIGLWYIPLFVLVIVSTANAVNITDGQDGLAGGLLSIVFGAYIIIALSQGKLGLAVFSASVVGAVLAYTWYNIYPARYFMGDTGSLALGATLGVIAMLTNTAVILPIIAFVFVIETSSVILQLFWKKYFKRKLFPIAPLHHTLEVIGWHESKVTQRLWVIGAIFAVIGLVLALIGSPVS